MLETLEKEFSLSSQKTRKENNQSDKNFQQNPKKTIKNDEECNQLYKKK